MTKYNFEKMKEEYLKPVLEIYNYYILNTTATFHANVLDYNEMREFVFFQSDKYQTFVVLDEEMICGYVLITQHKNREAYDGTAEVTIYLKPDCVSKGVGSKSLAYIEEYAKLQGIHVLVATVCGENQASIRLFEKNGYQKCAHYKEVGQKFGRFLDIVAYQKILPVSAR